MKWNIIGVIFSLVAISEQRSTPAADHYVAAVVEYMVQSNTQLNVINYVELMRAAADRDADVIVFPELTLTSRESIEVPIHGRLQDYPVPALNPEMYDETLVRISEAARLLHMYVVINLEELMDCADAPGEYCPDSGRYRFNTNVVFDRRGAIIDRYRKINLYGEFSRTPALRPDLGVFETDFGVTFGHFICFDLKYQVPAVQMVQKYNLTDIIYPTMWYSELPYLTAVQIQEAYAYTQNVNLLAAGANDPRVGSAGSGIYSGKAGALISIMPGAWTTRLLVARVPKTPGAVPPGTYPGPQRGEPASLDGLYLLADPTIPAHVTRLLKPGSHNFTLIDKEVICDFRVKLSYRNAEKVYSYRASAFSGVRTYGGIASGGVRLCSVMACYNSSIESCGERFNQYVTNSSAVFDELSITASLPSPVWNAKLGADDSIYFPTSSDASILPLKPQDFTFDRAASNGRDTYRYSLLNSKAELLGFAVWGRVFDRDGQPPTVPRVKHESHGVPVVAG